MTVGGYCVIDEYDKSIIYEGTWIECEAFRQAAQIGKECLIEFRTDLTATLTINKEKQ